MRSGFSDSWKRAAAIAVALASLMATACYSANLVIRPADDPRRVLPEDEVNAVAAALADGLLKVGLVPMSPRDLAYLHRDSEESEELPSVLIASFHPKVSLFSSDEETRGGAERYLGGERVLVDLLIAKKSRLLYVEITDRNRMSRTTAYEPVERAVLDALAKFPELKVTVKQRS